MMLQIKYQATNNNIEVLGLSIQHNTMPIYIINVYSPPGYNDSDNYDLKLKLVNEQSLCVYYNNDESYK